MVLAESLHYMVSRLIILLELLDTWLLNCFLTKDKKYLLTRCVCVCARAHVRVCVCARTCVHVCAHLRACVRAPACMHVHVYCVCVSVLAHFINFNYFCTLKVDVFAFGMTIYELLTMRPPYDELPRKEPHILHKYVRDGRRPLLTDKVINGSLSV